MSQFRKKPVVIEAIEFTGADALVDFAFDWGWTPTYDLKTDTIQIHTLEGIMTACVGDWIIRGVQGELYPCKPDIFAATYERADA